MTPIDAEKLSDLLQDIEAAVGLVKAYLKQLQPDLNMFLLALLDLYTSLLELCTYVCMPKPRLPEITKLDAVLEQ